MQPERGRHRMALQRQQSTGVLTPIRESRVPVRFSYVHVVYFNADVLRAKKVTTSRTQDCLVLSDEQQLYHVALMTRWEMSRNQGGHASCYQARARAELLCNSLNADDEEHLGFEGRGVPECMMLIPPNHVTVDEQRASPVVPTGDGSVGSDCADPPPKFWSSRSLSLSSDGEDRPTFWSSWSTESESVFSKVRAVRSAVGDAYSRRTQHIKALSCRWTRRRRNRVQAEFDDVMASLERANESSDV
eukprot:TRINITY_DN18274_c0_g1_i1.p1 TRINITY_DN18274_c0_g1~~TRINITY_DN18274_c0_g1_i1.p1  ORF type:complete len:246 (-),score=22.38 TRINITY_DN18274_c0_g1_i1:201-938(-)